MYKWKNPPPTAFLPDAPLDSCFSPPFSFRTVRGGPAEIVRDLGSQGTQSSVFLRSKTTTTTKKQAVTLDNNIMPKRTGRKESVKISRCNRI